MLGTPALRAQSRGAAFAARLARAEAALGSAEVLVLGNSHFEGGLPDRAWSRPALNLAFGAQDAYYDAELLLRFGPRLPNLRAVVLPAEPFDAGFRLIDCEAERSQVYDYAATFGIPPDETLFGFLPVGGLRLLLARSYLVRYHDQLFKFFHAWLKGGAGVAAESSVAAPAGSFGAPGLCRPQDGFDAWGADRARFHFGRLWRAPVVATNAAHLGRALAWCRARNLRVLLVTPPFHAAYGGRIPPAARVGFAAFLARLLAPGGPAPDYLDGSREFETDATLFRDPDHLNDAGARRFTALVEGRLFPR